MIFPSNRVRIMVATKPVDFRKGHYGLAALVKNEPHKDPFTGTVFVFRSRKADRLKLIYWDGSGIVLAYKRLEEHSFTGPGINARSMPKKKPAELEPFLQNLEDAQVSTFQNLRFILIDMGEMLTYRGRLSASSRTPPTRAPRS
jgi:transposase